MPKLHTSDLILKPSLPGLGFTFSGCLTQTVDNSLKPKSVNEYRSIHKSPTGRCWLQRKATSKQLLWVSKFIHVVAYDNARFLRPVLHNKTPFCLVYLLTFLFYLCSFLQLLYFGWIRQNRSKICNSKGHVADSTASCNNNTTLKKLPILVKQRWARSWSRCTGSQPAGDYKSSTQQ